MEGKTVTIKEVFAINGEGEQKKRWTKVGIAFVNRDGSINVILDALPVNGRLQIRDRAKEKKADQ